MSADKAFALLKPTSASGAADYLSGPRLAVAGVRFGTATFATDRGPKKLPAWLISFSGVSFPTAVLAVAPAAQWVPPGLVPADTRSHDIGASLGNDHRTLTVRFVGARPGSGPCTSDYSLNLREYAAIVTVAIIEHRHGPETQACTLIGYSREASAVLAAPLGNQVMLDAASGGPIPVIENP